MSHGTREKCRRALRVSPTGLSPSLARRSRRFNYAQRNNSHCSHLAARTTRTTPRGLYLRVVSSDNTISQRLRSSRLRVSPSLAARYTTKILAVPVSLATTQGITTGICTEHHCWRAVQITAAFFSLPLGTKMFQFPRFAHYPYVFRIAFYTIPCRGFPHSDISGSKVACHLPGAFRRLRRPSSPYCTKASTVRPCAATMARAHQR